MTRFRQEIQELLSKEGEEIFQGTVISTWIDSLLAELFLRHGVPQHIRSDNGPEFIARKLHRWLKTLQVEPLYIEPGSPWENGYNERFNGTFRDELFNGEAF